MSNTAKIARVNYAFTDENIPTPLLVSHSEYVRQRVSDMFKLPLEAVKAQSVARLPEGAQFRITCYTERGETDPPAMALAAKIILSALSSMRTRAERLRALVNGWVPGDNVCHTEYVLDCIAEGFYVGKVSPAQRAWLEKEAFDLGADVNVAGWSDASLATFIVDKRVELELCEYAPDAGFVAVQGEPLVNSHDEY